MPSRFISTLAFSCALAAPALAQTPITVTSTANDGAGSLRAALAEAATNGAPIHVVTEGDIAIIETLSYDGTLPLDLIGFGQTIAMTGNATVLAVTNGADAMVSGLTLAGPGGYSIQNRGDADGPAGKGIFVDVRDDQTGVVTLALSDVTVIGVAGHGIHVSDCTLADDCGGGSGGAGEGSDASIAIALTNVNVIDAGNGRFDADGLRVDERGAGSILMSADTAVFYGVGADGVELDEGQAGSVMVTGSDMKFLNNGNYCDPAIMSRYVPQPDEVEFEEGTTQENQIPGPVAGSPDDTCVERAVDFHDDGSVEVYEFGLDLDDGFDIDEAGPGGLVVTLVNALVDGNLDEGIDFDEEGPGGIAATFIGGVASTNTDDGYKLSEEDAGDVTVFVQGAMALANGGKGFVFEEEDAGNVHVEMKGAASEANDDSDDTGLEVVQDDDGAGMVVVIGSVFADGVDAEGVEMK